MNFFPNAKKADWYKKPEIWGHSIAKENVDYANEVLNKWAKTRFQRKFVRACICDSDSWHTWNMYHGKTYVNKVRYAVRRISKCITQQGGYTSLLSHHNQTSGVLKTVLTHELENLAYKHDREAYFKYYFGVRKFYGFTFEQAEEDFVKYHERNLKSA